MINSYTDLFTVSVCPSLYLNTKHPCITRIVMGDGDALVAEYNSAGALTRRYLHGDQIDEPWVQYYGPNLNYERRFLYADHQGSIIAHSNYMGTLSNSLTYDAYGIPGSANLDRFGYTGQIWFKELGLFHYKARMYHPKLGRFLQTDPIFYADDMNMYAYVGNDPVNMIDPTGEASKIAWLIRLGASSVRDVARITKEQAVMARRSGDNVRADSRQAAKQIETAAHGKANQLKHDGHDLPDGTTGRPHFQTDGAKGHTFWGVVTAALLGGADMLDKAAQAAEIIDPTSYLTSGSDKYLDKDGNQVSFAELMDQAKADSGKKSNSDNGMSAGIVRICSGIGAEKGGCN